jgi:hypothetical protein
MTPEIPIPLTSDRRMKTFYRFNKLILVGDLAD